MKRKKVIVINYTEMLQPIPITTITLSYFDLQASIFMSHSLSISLSPTTFVVKLARSLRFFDIS